MPDMNSALASHVDLDKLNQNNERVEALASIESMSDTSLTFSK